MRAYEILFESDPRSKIQKLRDVIEHPATEDTIKAVAQNKLEILLSSNEEVQLPTLPRIVIETNLTDELYDVPFIYGRTAGGLYEALSQLQPSPSRINFLRQGTIQMMVPPPFMGLTKQQYFNFIAEAVGGCREIDSKMMAGQGYFITISFL